MLPPCSKHVLIHRVRHGRTASCAQMRHSFFGEISLSTMAFRTVCSRRGFCIVNALSPFCERSIISGTGISVSLQGCLPRRFQLLYRRPDGSRSSVGSMRAQRLPDGPWLLHNLRTRWRIVAATPVGADLASIVRRVSFSTCRPSCECYTASPFQPVGHLASIARRLPS